MEQFWSEWTAHMSEMAYFGSLFKMAAMKFKLSYLFRYIKNLCPVIGFLGC